MTISARTLEITQAAAAAVVEKLGTDLIAIDLSDQLVLSEVFLIATGQNVAQVDAICGELIEAAQRDFTIDLENSWMIGDKAIDVETGFNAKIKTAMVLTGYGRKDIEKLTRKPDIVAETLLAAVEGILKAKGKR